MGEGGEGVGASYRTTASRSVIEAIAEAEGVSPAAVSPPEYESLHTVVDPAALDALFADRANGVTRPGGTVSFAFCGYDVTVDSDGEVTLADETEFAD